MSSKTIDISTLAGVEEAGRLKKYLQSIFYSVKMVYVSNTEIKFICN